MVIDDFTLDLLNPSRARIAWTGTLAYVAWIFINGLLKEGPVAFETTAREIEINVPNPFRVEIHEAPEGVPIESAVGAPLTRRPLVWFSPRELAHRYNIYRRPATGENVRLVASIPHQDGLDHYEMRPGEEMLGTGGIWNFLRVEVENARGKESVRDEFPFFVAGLPALPVSFTPSGGGGVFDLEIGVS
jgi:hypothetical protein